QAPPADPIRGLGETGGRLSASGPSMLRIDAEDVLDRRGRPVERLRDPGAILEFHVVLDLPSEEILASRFPRFVGEANRPRGVRADVQLARPWVVGLFRLALFAETQSALEVPLLSRRFR